MIGEVSAIVTPTQYVALRITPGASGWEAVTLRAFGVDHQNGRNFEELVTLTEGMTDVVTKVGPFIKGDAATVSVTLLDGGGVTLDSWTDEIDITNTNSPGVIVRQAVYDIIEDASPEGIFLITDGHGGPSSADEDCPFVGADYAVEVAAPFSRKRQLSPVRSEVSCEIPINVYIIGHTKAAAFRAADNVAWQIQQLVDATPNLYLSGLGVNNYSWRWDVRTPDFVDVDGSAMPIVLQELLLTVPVIWVTDSNKS